MHKGFDLLRNVEDVRTIQTLHASQKIYHTVIDRIENQTTFMKDDENNDDDDDLMAAAEVDSIAFHNQIDELGTQINGLGISSAHQMGSCRMGANPFSGAVDEDGELWDADGVFAMDVSVFPTATGANPMVTTISISGMLSLRLVNNNNNNNNRKTKTKVPLSSDDSRSAKRDERRRKWRGKETGYGTPTKWSLSGFSRKQTVSIL